MIRFLPIFLVAFGLAAQTSDALNDRARDLTHKARETGDASLYNQASQALEQSFALKPANYEARKLEVAILLGRGEYAKARKLAKALQTTNGDDPAVYSLQAEADLALGNYKDAEGTTQWMLDLRPTDTRTLERAAALRFYLGDLDGASEMWNSALRSVGAEPEERAWILSQLAGQQLAAGKAGVAGKLVAQALAAKPAYHPAKLLLPRVRFAEGQFAESAAMLADLGPSYLLARALEKAGKGEEAARAYASFESAARSKMEEPANWNRDLVLYLVDHARKPAEALRVAEIEMARRKDVYTLDAYAWALHANGKTEAAQAAVAKIMAVGIRDAGILDHARQIAPARDLP